MYADDTVSHSLSQHGLGRDLLDAELNGDRLREECGVFGIFGHPDAAAITAASSREQREPRPRDLRLTMERATAALTTASRPLGTLFA